MKSNEQIIEALKTIKEVCNNDTSSCVKCPFHVCNTCGITDLEPHNWEINEPGKVWRALS